MLLRSSRFAASAAAVAIACAAVICLDATAAGANPGISVSPSTGLHDGQTVTVTGSGFTKNGTVYIVECKAGATSEGQCSFNFSDLSTVVVAKADGSGNLRSPSPALKSSFKSTDCTKVACEIAAHQTISFSLTAANTAVHSISFGASVHPSSAHSTPPTGGHSSTQGSTGTTAGTSTGTTASTSGTATSAGASTPAHGATSSRPGAVGQVFTTSRVGTGSSVAPADAQSDAGAPSDVAQTIKQQADNGGRYLLVAIIAVLAVLYIVGMGISGRRAARR